MRLSSAIRLDQQVIVRKVAHRPVDVDIELLGGFFGEGLVKYGFRFVGIATAKVAGNVSQSLYCEEYRKLIFRGAARRAACRPQGQSRNFLMVARKSFTEIGLAT